MKSSLCFVIMPFGGNDPERRRHFEGVYGSIICPAAARLGLRVKRSDLVGEPGNITHDIIRDLATADVVVADLTEGNANVFFELGIRHTLRKSGTVHIVDGNHGLPFDIQQYRAVKYSTRLADLPIIIEEIASAIRKRLETPTRSDNPVHDALPGLPVDVMAIGDEATKAHLLAMQSSLDNLQRERDSLIARIRDLDPAGMSEGLAELDVDAILDEADKIMMSRGEHALWRLSVAVKEGGADQFVKVLREILKSRFLDQNDLMQISIMCRRLGLSDHRRATLEVACSRFPANDEMSFLLASAYNESNVPALRERGRLMVEKKLGVVHAEKGPSMQGTLVGRDIDGLVLLFDLYFAMNQHEWVVNLATSVEALMGPNSSIIRNKARALHEAGRSAEAELEFKRAIRVDPTDDRSHSFYVLLLNDQSRYAEAFVESEQAVLCDPYDGTGYENLAIQILNHGFVRDSSGKIVGPIEPRGKRVRYAYPLLLRALDDTDQQAELKQHIITVLIRADAPDEAEAVSKGIELPVNRYDFSELAFLEEQIGNGSIEEDSQDEVGASSA